MGEGLKPDNAEQQAGELIEAKSEALKLRAQLRRTEEERDILKKGRQVICSAARVKYRFINDHRRIYRTNRVIAPGQAWKRGK